MAREKGQAELTSYQIGQAGEHAVAAELHRRGAVATTLSGNAPRVDLVAWDSANRKRISIQVKTKRAQRSGWKRAAGHWPVPVACTNRRREGDLPGQFWVFVDLPADPDAKPGYYVVPAWYVENDVYERHQKYCRTHPDQSKFRSIAPADIEQWRDRWDILGVCAR